MDRFRRIVVIAMALAIAALQGCHSATQDSPASAPSFTGIISRIESQGRNTAQILVDQNPNDQADGEARVRVTPTTRIVRRSGHVAISAGDLKTGEHVSVWLTEPGTSSASVAADASILMLEDVPGRSGHPAGSGQAGSQPPPARTPPVTRPPENQPPATEPPAGNSTSNPLPGGIVVLREVREASHHDFDRVVFEFAGDALPEYHLDYLRAAATQCGSGAKVNVAGRGRLEVRLRSCQAHDDAGHPTVAGRDRHPAFPVIEQIVLTCDFEGHVTWVLGVSAPNKYEVHELRSPARLVVDVRH